MYMDDRKAKTRILWLIVIRLVIALSILSSAILIQLVSKTILPINPLYFLIALILSLTVIHLFFYRKNLNENIQCYFQLSMDILFITSLIYLTGGFQSPFSFLYVITIITASILLSRRGTIIITMISAIAFGLLVDLMHLAIIPYYDPEKVYVARFPIQTVYYNLFINFVALSVTAWLGIYLSERAKRSYDALQEKELKLAQLQQLYQNVIQSMPSGLLTLEADGTIIFANNAARKILRLTDKILLPVHHFNEVFSSIVQFAVLVEMINEKTFYRMEGSIICDNEKIEIGAIASALKDFENKILGYLIVFQDITDIKLLQEKVKLKDRMAALGEMAAGMAHEIRNPLSAIKGSIQLIKQNVKSANADELLTILMRESDRLNKIIEAFLNFARPPSYVPEKQDIRTVIRDAISFIHKSGQINDKTIIEFTCPENACIASIDRDQFIQAVWNIIKNAIQAMPAGGTVLVNLRDENHSWKLEFHDTGIGIDALRLKSIFDPFQRSTTGGLGLGMAITYRIVKEHFGNIDAVSIPGMGTTIIITLPQVEW
jgi:two-component system, NtrC family, sensor histidine kinase PilS